MIRLTQEQFCKIASMVEVVTKEIEKIMASDISIANVEKDERLRTKYELEFIMNHCCIITEFPENEIGIGTKFNATIVFEGKKSIIEQTLVEVNLPCDKINSYVSLESPLGKSILGKKPGETFTLKLGESTVITITINEIIKDKSMTKYDSQKCLTK
ncbi:MAG: GreA/GreB family elongation factor [Bacilli bacterium]